ncbi:acyl-CoA synthetase [Paraburkholderia phymatum]|uniref:AMP-dependent synthetase and ligase n=1 Tax=Paraburkholderia phymatum (strain DSM 17167 / CIP 108236 / LMG 21445 / STM815) TaxID=391038 RepID=B2JSJ9_PARP8|nr:acyl-CoA synthetase [Paraburkholderia phymatum]ACC74019.1 AMP-dependent synthetase and ligase [Paraburkholderia phymatum STM815]
MSPASVTNLAHLLRQSARQFPQRTAVVHRDRTWNWSEIDSRVDAMVAALRSLGVRPGDKILVQSRNCVQMFESCWVAFRLGAVWVPTNFRLTPPEVAYLGSSSGACAMIVEEDFQEYADAVRAASPDLRHIVVIGSPRQGEHSYEDLVAANLGTKSEDAVVDYDTPLWFFYTSGTTGRPKAAILTHGQMAFVVANHLADVLPGLTELDCSIVVAPLSHGAGIQGLLNVARGAAAVILPSEKMEPEVVWALVEKHKVSNFFAVPTIIKILVEHPAVDRHDHSSLRYINYGGAPMYRADQKLALTKLGRVLVQHFGLGEATACITVLPPHMHSADDDDPAANIGSCGRPRTGMEVAILDADLNKLPAGEVGEICCRGPAVFAGYYGNQEATEKAFRGGWFHTGDLGKLDERGLLYITGRESDMYISGGSNVYPREVEEILLTHPSVAEVAVLGIPDPKWGEVGVAVVVLRDDAPPVDAAGLLNHLEGCCARYRWPKHVFFWESLPKSGYGKITKKEVRQKLFEREASLLEVKP